VGSWLPSHFGFAVHRVDQRRDLGSKQPAGRKRALPFNETLPFLKVVPGVKMERLSDCEPAAEDQRVDVVWATLRRAARGTRSLGSNWEAAFGRLFHLGNQASD
jgi:hypothetical protein